jgi:hypothetical protein
MPRLLGQSQEITGQVFDLSGARITIGRTPDNQIHLPDNSVATHHAELTHEGADYTVRDLGSETGTRINGQAITSSPLRRGDVLQIGSIDLLYDVEGAAPATQAALPVPHAGISLGGSVSRGRPAHFVSSGPSLHTKKKEKLPWTAIASVTGVIAGVAVAYLLYVLLATPLTS